MKWKTAALAALLTIAASTGAMAYDMNTLAEKTLPKSFKYMAIPGEQTMEFNGAEVPYKMGAAADYAEKKPEVLLRLYHPHDASS